MNTKLKLKKGDTEYLAFNIYTDEYYTQFNVTDYEPYFLVYDENQTTVIANLGLTGATTGTTTYNNRVDFVLSSGATNISTGNYTYEIQLIKGNEKHTPIIDDVEIVNNKVM